MQQSNNWTKVAWLEPFWIALLAPSLLFSGRFWAIDLQPILILLLLLFWPLRRLAYGRFSIRSPLDWPLALLIGWLPMSLWVSVDRSSSWAAAGVLCLGVASYYAMINWPPARRRPEVVAWMLAAIGLSLILLGPVLVATPIPFFKRLGFEDDRLLFQSGLGEKLNTNVWAGSLLLVIPLYAGLAITPGWSRRFWPRLAWALLGLLAVGLLFLTDSRGAYLALVLSLLTLLMLRWPRNAYVGFPLLLIGSVSVALIDIKPVLDYLFSDLRLSGWSGRPEIWLRAISAIQDFPWTGVGIGLFPQVIPVLYPYFLIDATVEHAHNLLLQIGVDMGLPGLIAYLAILLGTFVMAARHLHRPWHQESAGDPPSFSEMRQRCLNWALAAGVVSALVAMLVHGLVDAVTWGTKLAFMPWLLFALATNLRLSLVRRRKRKRRSSSATSVGRVEGLGGSD